MKPVNGEYAKTNTDLSDEDRRAIIEASMKGAKSQHIQDSKVESRSEDKETSTPKEIDTTSTAGLFEQVEQNRKKTTEVQESAKKSIRMRCTKTINEDQQDIMKDMLS